MSKTVKFLWLVSLLIVAISVAALYFGSQYEISHLPKPEESSSHGGFTIVCGIDPDHEHIIGKWIIIAYLLLIAAVAFAIAAVRVWYQDKSEKKETFKEHFVHSQIINIEGTK